VDKLLSRGKNIIPAVLKFLSFVNDGTITDTLIQRELRIATMESCTSGLIASTITDYEGASAILSGSTITYSNNAKVMAGVSQDTIDHYGVYSLETATAMAAQTKATFQCDISIGITGSFSNVDPNNEDSVAGMIFYEILYRGNELPIKLVYHNLDLSRKEIKQRTVDIVLATLSAMLS
jgi:PncC family amidohydrolase